VWISKQFENGSKPNPCLPLRSFLRAALLSFCAIVATSANAQNLAPDFSHGPTVPFFVVEFDSTGDAQSNMLSAGAGYSFNWNLFPSAGGTVRHLTLGVPLFVQLPTNGEFVYSVGLTAGTFNNLLSVGVVAELVNTESNTGALLGDWNRENLKLVFALGFNLGGGTQPSGAALSKAVASGRALDTTPPPGYISF